MREALRRLLATARRRLAGDPRRAVLYGSAGAFIAEAEKLPDWIACTVEHSIGWVLRVFAQEMVSVMVGSLVLAFGIRLCSENGSDLLRRPIRFALLVSSGAALATGLAWAVSYLVVGESALEMTADRLFHFWMQAILWGGLFGWLYLLSLQRSASRLVLDTLLSRRALLANQVARARLGRARAQFDPAMVALVLRTVHERYRIDPGAGSLLLDSLIAYLRLAMSRRQVASSSTASDIALIRSLVALREAEHGIGIDLQIDPSFKPLPGAFEQVCARLDQAIQSGHRPVRLHLSSNVNHEEHEHVAIQAAG